MFVDLSVYFLGKRAGWAVVGVERLCGMGGLVGWLILEERRLVFGIWDLRFWAWDSGNGTCGFIGLGGWVAM